MKKYIFALGLMVGIIYFQSCSSEDNNTDNFCSTVDFNTNTAALNISIYNGNTVFSFQNLRYAYIERESIINGIFTYELMYTNYDVATTSDPFNTLPSPARLRLKITGDKSLPNGTYSLADANYKIVDADLDYIYNGNRPYGLDFDIQELTITNMTDCWNHEIAVNLKDSSIDYEAIFHFKGDALLSTISNN